MRFKSEAAFQKHVIALAKLAGWEVFHQGDMRHILSGVGYPDLTLISQREPRVIFAELKTNTGETSAEQVRYAAVISSLGIRGVEYYLWRPKHLEKIKQVLKGTGDPERRRRFTATLGLMLKESNKR